MSDIENGVIKLGDKAKSPRVTFFEIDPEGNSGKGEIVFSRAAKKPLLNRSIPFTFTTEPSGVRVKSGGFSRHHDATVTRETDGTVTIHRETYSTNGEFDPTSTGNRNHQIVIPQINSNALTSNTTKLADETALLVAAGAVAVNKRLLPRLRVGRALRRAGLMK